MATEERERERERETERDRMTKRDQKIRGKKIN